MMIPAVAKRNRLRNLRLSEVSIVDRPANPHATIVLHKRDQPAAPSLATHEPSAPANPLHARAAAALHLLGGDGAGASMLLNRIDKSAAHDLAAFIAKKHDPERTRLADLIVTAATDDTLNKMIAMQQLERSRPDLAAVMRGEA